MTRSGRSINRVARLRGGLIAALAIVAGMTAPKVTAQTPIDAASRPATSPATSSEESSPRIETPSEAKGRDAAEYARQIGVPLDDALRRLSAQEESVAFTDRLQQIHADRLAGIAIEHQPAYRIVVLLTGSQPEPDQSILAGGMVVPVHFRTGASATRQQLLGAFRAHRDEIRAALPMVQGMGVDQRSGELVAMFRAADIGQIGVEALTARIEALAAVPVRIRSLDGTDSVTAIDGGARVEGMNPRDGLRYVCTSGFVVTDGTRTGVTTAAHCPYGLSYRAPDGSLTPLLYSGAWGALNQDVQVQLGAESSPPLFYADTPKTVVREVTGERSRQSTRAGDFVCHRGERTGYSCALVDLVDYAPPANLCAGPCEPVWVTVSGPDCSGGDSGAPVFDGTVALGLVKGASFDRDKRCNFYFYMSTDYLPQPWSVLTTPTAAIAGLPASPER